MTDLQIRVAAAAFLAAMAVSAVMTALARRWARQRDLVDRPGGHKAHGRPVALLGGVAIVAAVLLPMLLVIVAAHVLLSWADAHPTGTLGSSLLRVNEKLFRDYLSGICLKTHIGLAVVGGGLLLHVVGLYDDLHPLGAGPKLAAQVFVAALLVVGFNIRLLTALGPTTSIVLSILWIVGLTNAFNFLDNMDGLASGVALIAVSVFAATAMQSGQLFVPACCWLLAGALAGFLPFNVNPASIFLGDAGSLVIGYLIAVLTILTTFVEPGMHQTPAGVLAPLVVMAVPVYDTASVMVIRWREGRSLWHADRRHFSHRLVQGGLSVREAVGVIWLATFITAMPAVMLPRASWPVAIGILGQTAGVVLLVAYLEKAGQKAS